MDDFLFELQELIASNKIKTVIKTLLSTFQKCESKNPASKDEIQELRNQVVLLSARYTETTAKINSGIIDPIHAGTTKNQLISAFLNLISELPSHTEFKDYINGLEEEKAWDEAAKANSINAYRTFFTKYPQGKYKEETQRIISELESIEKVKEADFKQKAEEEKARRSRNEEIEKTLKEEEQQARKEADFKAKKETDKRKALAQERLQKEKAEKEQGRVEAQKRKEEAEKEQKAVAAQIKQIKQDKRKAFVTKPIVWGSAIGLILLIAAMSIFGGNQGSLVDDKLEAAKTTYQNQLSDAKILFDQEDYETAKSKYNEAKSTVSDFDLDPTDAEKGIVACDEMIANGIEAQGGKDRLAAEKAYQDLLSEAKGFFDKKDYETAKSKYNEAKNSASASEFDLDSTTAENGIVACETKITELASQQSKEEKKRNYNTWKKKGNNAFNKGNYTAAKEYYSTAAIYMNYAEIKGKISACDVKIAEEEKQKRYQTYLSRGNNNFVNGDYKKAKADYQTAQNYNNTNDIRKKIDSCNEKLNPSPSPPQTYSSKKMKDGKIWMTENLNREVANSWCLQDDKNNCNKYGRLYTWKAAKKACPSGWHLPSDKEWKALANAYGGYKQGYHYSEDKPDKRIGDPNASFKALIDGGSSGFSALIGGSRSSSGTYFPPGGRYPYGSYWSSSEHSSRSDDAWAYSFGYNTLGVNEYGKTVGYSCRCIKN